MILFRHADPRYPFLWEDAAQPPGRWHAQGEGPAHYFTDTPNGAWAELLRHEEIRDPEDAATLRRALWAVEVPDAVEARPELPGRVLLGGPETYARCQAEARRLRQTAGTVGLRAPSAALEPGGAAGWTVEGGLKPAEPRDGEVVVLFGRRTDLEGWPVVRAGHPPTELLERVRHFSAGPAR